MTRQQAGVSAVPYGKPTLTFGDGEYSCASCGLGMREPCQHWRGFLEAAATAPPEQASGQLRLHEDAVEIACCLFNKGLLSGQTIDDAAEEIEAWFRAFFPVRGTCGSSQPETEGEAGRQPDTFCSPSVQAEPPQPASAGTLEQEVVIHPRCSKCGDWLCVYIADKKKVSLWWCGTCKRTKAAGTGEIIALAAHDQKVRGGCAFCDAGDAPIGHLYHLTQEEGRPSCGNCACAECASRAVEKK